MASARMGLVPTVVLALTVPVVALVTVVVTLQVTDDATSAAPRRAASGTAIAIENFQYAPDPITVSAGARVTVTNDDGTVHTLTADQGQFDTGDLDGGASKSITINAPGTYAYHCTIHNYMTGTIEVR
jgi:plastocyanin